MRGDGNAPRVRNVAECTTLDGGRYAAPFTIHFLHDAVVLSACRTFAEAVLSDTTDKVSNFAGCHRPVRLLAILLRTRRTAVASVRTPIIGYRPMGN